MATIRLQIVTEIAEGLGAATGLPVHRNLDYALEDRNLPVLAVTSGPDQPADSGSPLGMLDQEATLEIDILLARSPDPETSIDPHEAAVHSFLAAVTNLAGQPVTIERISGDWVFDLGDCVARRLSYRYGYRTAAANLEI